ncbi:uncharacterized protein RBU33_014591 [Hipposideros larvatus]
MTDSHATLTSRRKTFLKIRKVGFKEKEPDNSEGPSQVKRSHLLNSSSATSWRKLCLEGVHTPDISPLFESGDSTWRQHWVPRREVSVDKFSNAPLPAPLAMLLLSWTKSRMSFPSSLLTPEQEFRGWRPASAVAHSTPGQS